MIKNSYSSSSERMDGSSIIPNNTKPNINVNMKAMYLPSRSHCMQSINKGRMTI